MFSEFNNLTNLTMRRYGDSLGYTQEELETCFTGHIERFAHECGKTPEWVLEEMRKRYGGYRFSEKDIWVYNPFFILTALQKMAFASQWLETEPSPFLVNLLRDKGWNLPGIEGLYATEISLGTYDIERPPADILLVQDGYLTIQEMKGDLFILNYPNQAVKTGFLTSLFHDYSNGAMNASRFLLLADHLIQEDFPAFIDTMTGIFASIPYTLETKRDEAYFHTVFYLMVSASGIDARSEVLTSQGRIDLVMEFRDKVFILEFKCGQSAGAAIRQIREKRYADRWNGAGKAVFLLGIDFDPEQRTISEWTLERA